MEDLKTVLFEETLYHFNRYEKAKREFGEFDILTDFPRFRFQSLYRVIENSGLENEYLEWKKGR